MKLTEFDYDLPTNRIAQHPLEKRDESKLLIYNRGRIEHDIFEKLPQHLPDDCQLVFNNTKVIPARFKIRKPTGAVIEILLLHPESPSRVVSEAMETTKDCTWECMIGNKKRWKTGSLIQTVTINDSQINLKLGLVDPVKNHVRFSWDNVNITFAHILEASGSVPLPPYLNRKPDSADKTRYQTIYSKWDGAVAAPTAGLHFTQLVMEQLKDHGVAMDYLTLHVGAGTFLPVTQEDITLHNMHYEEVVIDKSVLVSLVNTTGPIIPVGTTSLRTLESLYWYGVQLTNDPNCTFNISSSMYDGNVNKLPSRRESLEAVLQKTSEDESEQLVGRTGIFIYPGYKFQMCDGLITNFHQPKSSLIMLVAAMIGDDWKNVYQTALQEDYRFLSYGDSSLLLP